MSNSPGRHSGRAVTPALTGEARRARWLRGVVLAVALPLVGAIVFSLTTASGTSTRDRSISWLPYKTGHHGSKHHQHRPLPVSKHHKPIARPSVSTIPTVSDGPTGPAGPSGSTGTTSSPAGPSSTPGSSAASSGSTPSAPASSGPSATSGAPGSAESNSAGPNLPVTNLRLAVVLIHNTPVQGFVNTNLSNIKAIDKGYFTDLAALMANDTFGQVRLVKAGAGIFTVPSTAELNNDSKAKSCVPSVVETIAKKYLAAHHVAYDRISIQWGTYCSWSGLAQVGGPVNWELSGGASNLTALIHEFGHNFGFAHSPFQTCASGNVTSCKASQYGGSGVSPMGGGGSGSGYSSSELMSKGLVPSPWVTDTASDGTYDLTPLYAPVDVAGSRVIEIAASATRHYLVELRQAEPLADSAWKTRPGVRIYQLNVGRTGKFAYDSARLLQMTNTHMAGALPAGTVISDGALRLTVGSDSVHVSGL